MKLPQVGLSLMPSADFLSAAQPLFEAGQVEVLEWSFDMGWGHPDFPDWAEELLQFYSDRHSLIGHGVSFSLLSAQWTERQEVWLQCLEEELQDYHYLHISEHFGWMTAQGFDRSAPLPLPLSDAALELGHDRLQKLAAFGVPVGLENLAFAFGTADVAEQGQFLEQLLQPVDGFLVLDLHNLYCQVHNFGRLAVDLLAGYPLERVRELHISGGSWSGLNSQIRRDTHDGAVPEEVFELLTLALQRCPQVEVVIFERMGNTLTDLVEVEAFRKDFYRIKEQVRDWGGRRSKGVGRISQTLERSESISLEELGAFQSQLLDLLDRHENAEVILSEMRSHHPAWQPYLETFEGRMVEVAAELVKKWGDRSP